MGRGVHANSKITTKKIMYMFSFFTAQQQLSFGFDFGGDVV